MDINGPPDYEEILRNDLESASRTVWNIFHIICAVKRGSKPIENNDISKELSTLMKNLGDTIKNEEMLKALNELKEFLKTHGYDFPEWIFKI